VISMVVGSGVGTSVGSEFSCYGGLLNDELEVAVGRAPARGMNLVKKCAAKDFCDAARSDLRWAALLTNVCLTRQMQRLTV